MTVPTNKKPNVIWIFGDQHRGQTLSFMGDPNLSTPNIDRLAISGIASTCALTNNPLCCPARGTLLTSRYSHLCVPGHQYPLPDNQPTIATVMNAAGYHTAYFGKWHLDGFEETEGRAAMHIVPPQRRGDFQKWIGYENNNSQWDTWVHGGKEDQAFHYRLPGYETDELTSMLIDYLETQVETQTNDTQQPFFAVLSVQPPHDPYLAPADFAKHHNPTSVQLRPNVPDVIGVTEQARLELAGYHAMVENLDWNVGRILQTLESNNLLDDTHIFFFSDHGDMLGSHGQFRKTSPWQEAVQIPLIIGGHRSYYQNKSGFVSTPISLVDVAPTTLGLCEIDIPDWMMGTDYAGLRLRGKTVENPPDSVFIQSVIPTNHHHSIDRPWRGIVTNDHWKYVVLEGQPWFMFNLNDDPYEQVNLAFNTQYQKVRKRLQSQLTAWFERTGDEFKLN